ncbi:hypothetical protein L6R52_40285 [Myxococcota bacterium]|nr:hypothetical protein [Myxococcota bacterium]
MALERRDPSVDEDGAEVIDLVHLPSGTRPTPFASLEYGEVTRCRVLDCSTYASCLAFAARLQWPSFHCRQCPRYEQVEGRAVFARERVHVSNSAGPEAAVIKLR